jgi:hypothetical protein
MIGDLPAILPELVAMPSKRTGGTEMQNLCTAGPILVDGACSVQIVLRSKLNREPDQSRNSLPSA